MGTSKNQSAANKVIEARKQLLNTITTCESLAELKRLEKNYTTDDRYAVPKASTNLPRNRVKPTMSVPELQELVSLDKQIKEAFETQKNTIEARLVQPKADLSASLEDLVLVDERSEQDLSTSIEGLGLVDERSDVESHELPGQVQQAEISPLQELRRIAIARIEAELVNVANKCDRMSKKGDAYVEATLATRRIHHAIHNLTEKYIEDGDLQHFQEGTSALLDKNTEDMKTINEHRGWAKNFLGNLALFILGGGVGYAVVCAYRGKFFEFNTDTANVVGAVNEKISALSMS
ncbi:hypothetical protein ACD661_01095 [Legionella lytica]|uniref:Uncharacterized protein n=1 Tax=Legionella lytica TaxID=96232 RepID=A0ABW8D3A0_9GAMM